MNRIAVAVIKDFSEETIEYINRLLAFCENNGTDDICLLQDEEYSVENYYDLENFIKTIKAGSSVNVAVVVNRDAQMRLSFNDYRDLCNISSNVTVSVSAPEYFLKESPLKITYMKDILSIVGDTLNFMISDIPEGEYTVIRDTISEIFAADGFDEIVSFRNFTESSFIATVYSLDNEDNLVRDYIAFDNAGIKKFTSLFFLDKINAGRDYQMNVIEGYSKEELSTAVSEIDSMINEIKKVCISNKEYLKERGSFFSESHYDEWYEKAISFYELGKKRIKEHM